MVLTAALVSAAWSLRAQTTLFDPHGDPNTGVERVATLPSTRGQCGQCHISHGDDTETGPQLLLLFTDNSNRLAFWSEGDQPCHREKPENYPLMETDRLPDPDPDAGYFEANASGVRRTGVNLRGRWTGEQIWSDPGMTSEGHYFSPHAQDPDMPRRDGSGEGLCLNCHDPHGSENPHDILVAPYGGISGHAEVGAPARLRLCLACHGRSGLAGMDPENRRIEDYYDSGLNGATAGHQIRRDPRVAVSWPAHILAGDKLPCYDCHNPHGSEGGDGVQPNAFLLSDERPEWSGLVRTVSDPAQCRAFCFGCHIPSDGIPGTKEVEGIVMNTIPNVDGHASSSAQSCYACHDSDYSGPEGHNVHNPRP
jgi:hypothetical protein